MFQEIHIIGRLGRDPEMRYTPNGTAMTSFSVATDRQYTKDNQTIKETCWFRVTAWGKRAEACTDFLRKGSKVFVSGTLTPDDNGGPKIWTGKDGLPHANFELNASEVKFLDNPGGNVRRMADDTFPAVTGEEEF